MENESIDGAPQPPIGRAFSVVVLGNADREHPIEDEIAEAVHAAGERHGLDVMASSGPYYSDGDEQDQKLATVTAELVKVTAALAKVKDALHNPDLTTDLSRLVGISAVLNTLTPLADAEIAHGRRISAEIQGAAASQNA